jgi:hypothetical protein
VETGPGGFGEMDGVADHLLPSLIAILELGFVLDGGEGLQHELAEPGESDGGALRDAALGESGEDFAENVVDVCGGEEVAGEGGGELFAKAMRFQELLLVAGVEGAEGGVVFVAEHAAVTPVGEGELAGVGVSGFWAFGFHGTSGEVASDEWRATSPEVDARAGVRLVGDQPPKRRKATRVLQKRFGHGARNS